MTLATTSASDTCLFVAGLSISECASWVQAWGTVLAIVGAFAIAAFQARKQHQSAMQLLREQESRQRRGQVNSLAAVAELAADHFESVAKQLSSIDLLHNVARGETYFDFGATRYLDDSIQKISLIGLPTELVAPVKLLTDSFRQFRRNVDLIPDECTRMNDDDFAHFSSTMAAAREAIQHARDRFRAAATKVAKEAEP